MIQVTMKLIYELKASLPYYFGYNVKRLQSSGTTRRSLPDLSWGKIPFGQSYHRSCWHYKYFRPQTHSYIQPDTESETILWPVIGRNTFLLENDCPWLPKRFLDNIKSRLTENIKSWELCLHWTVKETLRIPQACSSLARPRTLQNKIKNLTAKTKRHNSKCIAVFLGGFQECVMFFCTDFLGNGTRCSWRVSEPLGSNFVWET